MKKRNNFDKRGDAGSIIFFTISVILMIIIVALLVFFSYNYLYLNLPGKPVELNATIKNIPRLTNTINNEITQFYPNMKFNHNNLSYRIEAGCSIEKIERMLKAFELLENDVNSLSFFESMGSDVPDIDITCSMKEVYNPSVSNGNNEFFIAGEGGAKEIIQTERFNVLNRGIILLYNNPENSIKCDWPNTEVHELIHVFGFNHSNNKNSLMYPYLEDCGQKLDQSIITELNRLYSLPNLPDLYFENVSATKKGRYLDFNITVRNSGDVDASGLSYSIIDDSVLVETKEIKDIKYGAGIVIGVSNLKLEKRDSKEIKIVIDKDNRVKEIDKENNVALIRF